MATNTMRRDEHTVGRRDATTGTATAMWLTIVGLAGTALTHLLDLPEKLEEAPVWESVGFLLLAVVALALIVPLYRAADRGTYVAAAAVAGITLLAYVVSRSTGLPGDAETVGEWLEPLGVLSVISELLVVAGAAMALRVRR